MSFLAIILIPMIAGTAVSLMKTWDARTKHIGYVAVMAVTDLLAVARMAGRGSARIISFGENVDLYFSLDGYGVLFMAMVMIMYTCVLFYSFEYMKMEEREEVFYAFYFISYGAMLGVCMCGNLVSMYLFFELATLSTVPLVLHEMTKEAIAAALKYLFYSVGGAFMGLLAVFFVYYYGSGTRDFVPGGFLDTAMAAGHEKLLLAMIFIGIVGFGTKAGMYPMHGWLPAAHPLAPAPASALLSGIITKAGIMVVIRMIYFSVGPDFIRGTWVQTAWMCLAMLTILMGSTMAFREKNLKKRLAYSSISQLSYLMLALSVLSTDGLAGGLLHLVQHAVSKGTLFLCAGVFIYKLHERSAVKLKGIGKQMPVTVWCFMIASLSLVGIPPMGGFASKWYIAQAALGDGLGVFSFLPPIVLLISALLTAGYLFPVVVDAFFPGEEFDSSSLEKCEPTALMTVPMIVLCAVALAAGLFAAPLASTFLAWGAGI